MSALLAGLGSLFAGGLFGRRRDNDGLKSARQGPTPPSPGVLPTSVEITDTLGKIVEDTMMGVGSAASSQLTRDFANKISGGAARQGKDARSYLSSAFPELNPWELAGASGGVGSAGSAQFANQKEIKQMELDNQQKVVDKNNDTQLKSAGIAAAASMKNAETAAKAPQEFAAMARQRLDHDIAQIKANTKLTDAQRAAAVAATMETYERTLGYSGQRGLTSAQTVESGTRSVGNLAELPAKVAKAPLVKAQTAESNERTRKSQETPKVKYVYKDSPGDDDDLPSTGDPMWDGIMDSVNRYMKNTTGVSKTTGRRR